MSDLFGRTTALDAVDRVGHDPRTDTFHANHDWSDDEPFFVTIVKTVAVAVGRRWEDMSPLYSVLDPDALETIMSGARAGGVRVSFSFEGCRVEAESGGEVVVYPDPDPSTGV